MTRIEIVDDDRDHAFIGTCRNCGRSGVKCRTVRAVGFDQETRGYFDICFNCFGPQITWRTDGRYSGTFTSPLSLSKGEASETSR